jgi:hypothetical protein
VPQPADAVGEAAAGHARNFSLKKASKSQAAARIACGRTSRSAGWPSSRRMNAPRQ